MVSRKEGRISKNIFLYPCLIIFLGLLAFFVYAFTTNQITVPVSGGNYTGTITINCSVEASHVKNVTIYYNINGSIAESKGSASILSVPLSNTSGNTTWAEYYNSTVYIGGLTQNRSGYNFSCVFYNGTQIISTKSVSANLITFDSTSPMIEVINNDNHNITNEGNYTSNMRLAAIINDTTGIDVWLWGGVWFNISNRQGTHEEQKGWLLATNATQKNNYTVNWTVNASGDYPEGLYVIHVYANDSLGNVNTSRDNNLTFVMDSHGPNCTFVNVTSYGNYSGKIVLNSTVADYIGVGSVYFNISNSSGGDQNYTLFNYTNNRLATNLTGEAGKNNRTYNYYSFVLITNTTSFPDGYYNITIIANDTSTLQSKNTSEVRRIMIDNTAPSITLTRNSNSTKTSLTIDITATDGTGSGSGACSVTGGVNPQFSGSHIGSSQIFSDLELNCDTSYTYTVTCIDFSRNSNSAAGTFSTDGCSGSGNGGGGGGAAPATGMTYSISEAQFTEGYTQKLSANDMVKVSIQSSLHSLQVKKIESEKVTIEVSSSTPQTATLSIGEEKKFDVTGDNYYDIQVKFNSVTGGKADITIKSIHEEIPAETQQTTEEETTTPETAGTEGEIATLGQTYIWGIIIVVVIIIAILIYYMYKKKKRY